MGLVRFAYKMLLRKRKESLAYGIMLFFLVITTVILSDVVNNPSIRHGEAYMGDFLITFIIFIVICFSSVMLYKIRRVTHYGDEWAKLSSHYILSLVTNHDVVDSLFTLGIMHWLFYGSRYQ